MELFEWAVGWLCGSALFVLLKCWLR